MADSFYEKAFSNGRQPAPRKRTPRARARTSDDFPPVTTEEILDMMRGLIGVVRRRVRDQATRCPNCGGGPTNPHPY